MFDGILNTPLQRLIAISSGSCLPVFYEEADMENSVKFNFIKKVTPTQVSLWKFAKHVTAEGDCTGVFRTLLSIYDGVFSAKYASGLHLNF